LIEALDPVWFSALHGVATSAGAWLLCHAECRADHLAQRLGAVDDEQPADLRVEPSFDQIVDEHLHDGGILGRPFAQAERVLIAEEAL
jgi:hypothetical protein